MTTTTHSDGSKTVYMKEMEWSISYPDILNKLNEGDIVIFTDRNQTYKVQLKKVLQPI